MLRGFLQGNGAYTGEVSADQLKDMGAAWVILGHSERRQLYKEDSAMLRSKMETALSTGLKVVYCVGELLEEREAGKTREVCVSQLEPVKDLLRPDSVVIAYEPVWAIGTGRVATPEQAQETHWQIRDYLATVDPAVASAIRIQVAQLARRTFDRSFPLHID
jgi:triosephosphate isomerase